MNTRTPRAKANSTRDSRHPIPARHCREGFDGLVDANPRTETAMRLAKILVPVDFSAESRNALRYAGAFARKFGASLTLLHVVEPIISAADFGYGAVTRRSPNQAVLKKAKARLNRLGRKCPSSRLQPSSMVRTGVAETEILRAARDLASDLIVMGTRGVCEPGVRPMGSTAEKVVRHAPCPILVVRKKEHDFVWCKSSKKSR